jgi:hypothetical protein
VVLENIGDADINPLIFVKQNSPAHTKQAQPKDKTFEIFLKNFALHPAHFARTLQPCQLCPCAS